MENETNKERKEEAVLEKEFKMIIPICCREGWDSCVHVVQRQKPTKRNIGL